MLKDRVREWEKALIEQGIQQGVEQGIEQGIERGIKQGVEQGIERGETGILLRQLERKFGPLSDELRQRIDASSSEQLMVWAERILTAEQIEDVFRT